MATLETLELTITADAEKASKGVDRLVSSLSKLSDAIIKPYSDLVDLNKELERLSKYGKMKFSVSGSIRAGGSGNGSGRGGLRGGDIVTGFATKPEGAVLKEFADAAQKGMFAPWMYGPNPGLTSSSYTDNYKEGTYTPPNRPGFTSFEDYHGPDWTRENRRRGAEFNQRMGNIPTDDGSMKNMRENLKAVTTAVRAGKGAASAYDSMGKSIKSAGDAARTAAPAMKEAGAAAKQSAEQTKVGFENVKTSAGAVKEGARDVADSEEKIGEAAERTQPKVSGLANQIQRIWKTMVIRTVVRSFIKGITDAWSNAYNFSRKMGGEFAKNVDAAKSAISSMTMNIVKTFAPAIKVLLPILAVVASAVEYLTTVISNLLQMLGLTSEMFGVTAEDITKTGDATKSSAKNVLAGFDELNVIQQGGGRTSTGKSPLADWTSGITEELAALKVVIGESLLAVGMILAFTGHIGPGLGLMVLGAASIASALTVDWKTLPDNVKNSIAGIMAAMGASEMAVGAVLAFTGANVGLGIAMIALGAANLVGAAVLSWKLSDDVKQKIATITGAVGGAMMAIGAVLAFSGGSLPLGIAMMAAGAAGMVSSIALSWSLDSDLKGKITALGSVVGGALLGVGALFAFTGANIPLGIGMMIAGAMGLAAPVALSWNLDKDIKNKATELTTFLGGSLLALGAVLAFSGANIPLGLGMMAAGGVSLASTIALNWDEVKSKVVSTFGSVAVWLTEKWGDIKTSVGKAWDAVSKWWQDGIGGWIQDKWKALTDTLAPAWNTVKTAASNAWDKVKNWWDDTKIVVSSKWEQIKSTVSGVWDDVKTKASSAWNSVSAWWNESKIIISSKWEDLKNTLSTHWENIKTASSGAWDIVSNWWAEKKIKIVEKWTALKSALTTHWENIKTSASNAWTVVSDWWAESKIKIIDKWNALKSAISTHFTNIKTAVSGAWEIVSDWWTESKIKIIDKWNALKAAISTHFTYIKTRASEAWEEVTNWWTDTKVKIIDKWSTLKTTISTVWTTTKKAASEAWAEAGNWWDSSKIKIVDKWNALKSAVSTNFDNAGKSISGAWESVKKWWAENYSKKITPMWSGLKTSMRSIFSNVKTQMGNALKGAKDWWETGKGSTIEKIKTAWIGVKNWFENAITNPIKNFFKGAINSIISGINWVIDKLNRIGSFTIPEVRAFGATIVPKTEVRLFSIPKIALLTANGAYDIQNGQLFIANEAGPELVGTMDGKTSVANQMQIIEGIKRGVSDANSEQNALLRRQNELLMQILQKTGNGSIGPSSALGRVVSQSLNMYAQTAGV